MAGYDVLLTPTLLAPPPPDRVLDQPRGTTRAFFDVESSPTPVDDDGQRHRVGVDFAAAGHHPPRACRSGFC